MHSPLISQAAEAGKKAWCSGQRGVWKCVKDGEKMLSDGVWWDTKTNKSFQSKQLYLNVLIGPKGQNMPNKIMAMDEFVMNLLWQKETVPYNNIGRQACPFHPTLNSCLLHDVMMDSIEQNRLGFKCIKYILFLLTWVKWVECFPCKKAIVVRN